MLVATFGPASSCPGRTITFENGRFVHEVLGHVSAADILAYDREGALLWPMDGMRAWVAARAAASRVDDGTARTGTAASPLRTSSASASWITTCPACRAAALIAGEPKTAFFGGASRCVWQCPKCGVQFIESKADGPVRYEIGRPGRGGTSLAKRFGKQGLTGEEWIRVTRGGSSDGEIASIDLENFLSALREGSTVFRMGDCDAPIALKRDEFVSIRSPGVVLREPRRVTQGVYGGPRVRLARNLSVNLGAFRAAPHEELRDVDQGELVVTNKRYVFMGEKRSISASLGMVVGIDPYLDAVAIHRSNKQRTETFCNLDRYGFSFEWAGRKHDASLTGRVVAYALEGLIGGLHAAMPMSRSEKSAQSGDTPRDVLAELERLANLLAAGAVTKEEFDRLKSRIMA